jgi:hypothetical protein
MTGRARSPLRHKLADDPSADMAPRPDFEKVLILRDMHGAGSNWLVFLKARPWDSMAQC